MSSAPTPTTPQSTPQSTPQAASAVGSLSLRDLASEAKPTRNRAIDFYRAVAMIAVALGHWMAMAVGIDGSGEIIAGNALEFDPRLGILSWLFQVMPLFFVVGGFSSAMSLDAFNASKLPGEKPRPQDWVIGRLRRMLAPTMPLAATWAVLIVLGFAVGQGPIVAIGAAAAAIPLWFLANYTIDTAIAPYVLPRFRKHPVGFALTGLSIFIALEFARFAGVSYLPYLNWVLGWLLFQVAGFAWRDGLLPTGKSMAAIAGGLWTLAIGAVTLGPYPVSMVHFAGLENSPTHPPSLALLLFGAAYSATAITVAPAISRWLANRPSAWAAVVGANTVAMSVYLWHFTAAILAGVAFHFAGWLPTAAIGSSDWWIQKLPLMGLSTIILAGIVVKVSPVERRALLAERTPWIGGQVSLLIVAGLLSATLKQWAHGDFIVAATCLTLVLALWHGAVKHDATITRLRFATRFRAPVRSASVPASD